MSKYGPPNDKDDLTTRLSYTVAVTVVYRLEKFLEDAHRKGGSDGAVPSETVDVVKQCSNLASEMLSKLHGTSMDAVELDWEEFGVKYCSTSTLCPQTVDMAKGAVRALIAVRGACAPAADKSGSNPRKAQMMKVLGLQSFKVLDGLCDMVEGPAGGTVANSEVTMLRACVDSAMGMLLALNSANWLNGQPLPGELVAALEDQIVSDRFDCLSLLPLFSMGIVYKALVKENMSFA
jgi:hypothetical protein